MLAHYKSITIKLFPHLYQALYNQAPAGRRLCMEHTGQDDDVRYEARKVK